MHTVWHHHCPYYKPLKAGEAEGIVFKFYFKTLSYISKSNMLWSVETGMDISTLNRGSLTDSRNLRGIVFGFSFHQALTLRIMCKQIKTRVISQTFPDSLLQKLPKDWMDRWTPDVDNYSESVNDSESNRSEKNRWASGACARVVWY